jgi:hypothetical protein
MCVFYSSSFQWLTKYFRDLDFDPNPQWQLRPSPPLRNRCRNPPEAFVPVRVFGFPMTEEDVLAWGAAHNISPDEPRHIREQHAWREIKSRLPPGRRARGIHWNNKPAFCFIIGSNVTKEDLARAADVELINRYHNTLRTKYLPGWFRLFT